MATAISKLPPYGKPSDLLFLIINFWEQLESILADPKKTYCSKDPGKHNLVLLNSAVEATIEFISNGLGHFWFLSKPGESTHLSLRAALRLKEEHPFEETPARALHIYALLHLLHDWLADENESMLPLPDEQIQNLIEFLKNLQTVEEQG